MPCGEVNAEASQDSRELVNLFRASGPTSLCSRCPVNPNGLEFTLMIMVNI